ncbi:putative Co/Zn/Cd efflux system membrane fusion protein [Nitrospira tepida]|uniref:Co/Zn/Cd efflux system membrane fusion protein n=1 Tax=Nitrospira tepida TaxID=2973512 RepID=A0AA86MVP6_9BACT|nr:efflux RND transporter periplasmic adaptor subunit [Nitrospira tepida]CAI4029874.1 putative Co/Zn/Cd efflux system membrane fusion protein [Nitrospira tepida]
MNRRRVTPLVLVLLLLVIGMSWVWLWPRIFPPAGSMQDSMTNMPGMPMPEPRPGQRSEDGATSPMPQSSAPSSEHPGVVTIPLERLQMIGVKYEPVARRRLEKTIRTVGRVAVDERRLAKVTIKFHGWIEELYVSALGDHVKKGQRLFTIYSPDLVASQEEYLLAVRGQKQLGSSEFPEVAQGSKDLLEAAKRRFQLWDITEDHIRELEQTGKVLKTLPIHSPITGTVIKKEALAGAHVEPGEELYTIADLSHVWILADIYEYELSFVKKDQKAAVTLSYDPSAILTGRVGFIYPTLDPKTRTAKVRFELDNLDEKLKPDMYANVELRVDLGTRLAIPQEAVIESGRKHVVFLHHGGGKLEPRLIKTGVKTGEWSEVLEGLKEGEHIVTSANFLIDSESRLKSAVESMGGMPGMK